MAYIHQGVKIYSSYKIWGVQVTTAALHFLFVFFYILLNLQPEQLYCFYTFHTCIGFCHPGFLHKLHLFQICLSWGTKAHEATLELGPTIRDFYTNYIFFGVAFLEGQKYMWPHLYWVLASGVFTQVTFFWICVNFEHRAFTTYLDGGKKFHFYQILGSYLSRFENGALFRGQVRLLKWCILHK